MGDTIQNIGTLLNEEIRNIRKENEMINTSYLAHTRMKTFQKSQTYRMTIYRNIIITLIIGSAFIWGLSKLKNVIGYLLISIVGATMAIIITFMLHDINKRDIFDHEKVHLSHTLEEDNKGSISLEDSKDCIGEKCCDSDEFFVENKCRAILENTYELGDIDSSPWSAIMDLETLPQGSNAKFIWNTPNSTSSDVTKGQVINFVKSYVNSSNTPIDTIVHIAYDGRCDLIINSKHLVGHKNNIKNYRINLLPGRNYIQLRVYTSDTIGILATFTESSTDNRLLFSTNTSWKWVDTKK